MSRRLVLLLAVAAAVMAAAPASALAASDRVVIAGGTHVLADEVVGDVFVIDGPVTIEGRVTGDVVALAGPVSIRGRVDGDVTAASDRAVLFPGARIGGDLLYGDEKPIVARGARVDGTISDEGWGDLRDAPWSVVGRTALWAAVSISTLALGLFLLWLAPGTADRTVELFRRRAAHVALAGLVLFIGLPAAGLVAVASLVGLPLGVAILLALVPLGAVGYVAGANTFGRLIAPRAKPWLAFVAGWAMLRALAIIPGIGIPLGVVAVGLGLGALLLVGWEARGGRPQPAREVTGGFAPPSPVS